MYGRSKNLLLRTGSKKILQADRDKVWGIGPNEYMMTADDDAVVVQGVKKGGDSG